VLEAASADTTYTLANPTDGYYLQRGTLVIGADWANAFGSKSAARYATGQITVGDQSVGAPLNSSTPPVGAVSAKLRVDGGDRTIGFRIQIISSAADSTSYLTYPLGINTQGNLLTISGVHNSLTGDASNALGGDGWTVRMYKYGGAIGIYGSTVNSGSDSATGVGSNNATPLIQFTAGSKLRLSGNSAQYGGGLGYYKEDNTYWGGYRFDFTPLAYLSVNGNSARSDGGGMYFYTNNDSVSHAGNKNTQLTLLFGRNTYFADNQAGGAGGAIYANSTQRAVELTVGGNSFFSNNIATGQGGAIYVSSQRISTSGSGSLPGKLTLDTSGGHIAFTGNSGAGSANSIYMEQNTQLIIDGPNNVYFDDPINAGTGGTRQGNSLVKSGAGMVLFRGSNVLQTTASSLSGAVSVSGGTFRVEKNASFSTTGQAALFSVNPAAGQDVVLSGGGSVSAAGGITLTGAGTGTGLNTRRVIIRPDSHTLTTPTYLTGTNTFSAADTAIAPANAIGTLSFTGNLSLNSTIIEVDARLDSDGQLLSDKIEVNGQVLIGAGNVMRVSLWNAGRYAIIGSTGGISYAGGGGITAVAGWSNEQISARKTMTLVTEGNNLVLDMKANAAQLTWNAQSAGSRWDYEEDHKFWNYTDGGTTRTDSFLKGDYVIFNAGSLSSVDLGGNTLTVYGMRINSGAYTFSNGTIRGLQNSDEIINTDVSALSGLTLGELLLTGGSVNAAFAGRTEFKTINIAAGAKAVANSPFVATDMLTIQDAGSSLSTWNGNLAGTPRVTLSNGGALEFTQNASYPGIISGTGGVLRNTGTGALTLTGTSTFSGEARIEGGSLRLEQGGSIANASVFINSGSVFNIESILSPTAVISALNGASGGDGGTVTLGTHNLQIGNNADSASGAGDFYGVITGAGGLIKQGGGIFTLRGGGQYSGATRIQGGTLVLGALNSLGISSELIMEAGTLDASGLTTTADSPLVLRKLSGGGGTVNLGNSHVTIGNGAAAGENWVYGGGFSGTGNLRLNSQGTLTLNGGSPGFTGGFTLSQGTLNLSAAGALGAAGALITAEAGTHLQLSAAGALASGASVVLKDGAALNAGGNQEFGRLVSEAASTANFNNYSLNLTTGTLAGTFTGLGGLTKANSASGDNTLTIDTNLNGGGTSIGDLRLLSSTGSMNSLVLSGGKTLTANSITLGNNSALTLSAGTHVISAQNMTIGTVNTELRINAVASNTTYDVIRLTSNPYHSADPGAAPGTIINDGAGNLFSRVYIDGVLNVSDPAQLTVKNYMAPSSVTLVNDNGAHVIRVSPAGLLWYDGGSNAHGYFWIDNTTVTIGDQLADRSSFTAMSGTGYRDSQWNGMDLIKEGSGTLVLTNAANTYTGLTDVRDGTLRVSDLAVLGGSTEIRLGHLSDRGAAAAPVFSLSGLGAGALVFDKRITGAGAVDLSGSGYEVQFKNPATHYTYTGATSVSGGTLSLHDNASIAASSGLTLGNNGSFDITAITGGQTQVQSLAGQAGGAVLLGDNTLVIGKDGETAPSAVFQGSFTGSDQSGIVKDGGGELSLGGASAAFTGTTTVKSGILTLTNSGAIANSQEVVMQGGILRASGIGAAPANPLVIKKLSGIGGNVDLGSAYFTIGEGTAGGDTWNYDGIFSGSRSITFNHGAGNTMELGGASAASFTGALTLQSGTLDLQTANTLGGAISAEGTSGIFLSNANALAANTRLELKDGAVFNADYDQQFDRLVSAAGTSVSASANGVLALQSGELRGTVSILGGLTKNNGTGGLMAANNTLTIDTNITGNAGNNNSIGALNIQGGSLAIQSGMSATLFTDSLVLGNDTRLTLNAASFNNTTNPIITALNTVSIGGNVRLDITGFSGSGTLTLINAGQAITDNFGSVYVDGIWQDLSGAAQNPEEILKTFRSTISLDRSDPQKINLNGGGLRWKLGSGAHGYFWIRDPLNVVTLAEDLANNAAVTGNPANSLQVNGSAVWNGMNLVKEGSGTLILTGNNTYTGNTEVRDGTLRISDPSQLSGTAKIVLGYQPDAEADGDPQTGANPIFNLSNYQGAFTKGIENAAQASGNVAGTVVIDNGSDITFAAGVYPHIGNYTYTGNTEINNATLRLATPANGISQSARLILGGGSLFDISGITAAATAVNNLRDRANGYEDTGNIALGDKTLRIVMNDPDSSNWFYSGIISGNGGGITKAGPGTLVLRGANDYTGATTVEEGTLKLEQNAVFSASAELRMNGGVFDFSGISAAGQDITRLSGAGGKIVLGNKALTIGNGAGGAAAYGGTFEGSGSITVDTGNTMTLTGRSTTGFSGWLTVKEGSTLELAAVNTQDEIGTIGGTIIAEKGTRINLAQANALSETARLNLQEAGGIGADLTVTAGSNAGAQHFDRLVSTDNSTVDLNSNTLTLNSGVLRGTVAGIQDLIKEAGSNENTLEIRTQLNNGAGIGDLTVSGGNLEIKAIDTTSSYTIEARNVNIGDGTRLTLPAVQNDIIHAENFSIGLGAELNITFDKNNTGFTIIRSDNTINTRFTDVYVNGGRQDPATANTVKTYHTELMVGYTNNAVTISGMGYLWNNELGNAHGYFWAEEVDQNIQIRDVLTDNAAVIADPSKAMRDFRNLRWNGKDLVKEGPGLLILDPESGGPAANTYTGLTEIRDGTLQISRAEALQGTSGIIMGRNADAGENARPVLNLYNYSGDFSKSLGGNGSLEVSGDSLSVVTLRGVVSYLGTTTVSGATLQVANTTGIASSSALYLGTNGVYDLSALDGTETTLSGLRDREEYGPEGPKDTGEIRLGADAANPKTLNIGSDTFDSSFTGLLSGHGRIVKTGDSSLRLGNDNVGLVADTESERAFEFRGGTLILSKRYPIGLYTNGLWVSGGSRLELEKAEIANPMSLGNELTIYVDQGQDSKLNGPISVHAGGISGAPLVVKTGTGLLTLGGNSDFTGNVLLSEGTLALEADTALGAGTNNLVIGASPEDAPLALRLDSAALPLTISNPISLGGDLNLEVRKAHNSLPDAEGILAGVISGTGGIIKNDPGIIALSGRETYTGATTITQGTLALRGTGDISKSSRLDLQSTAVFNIAGLASETGPAETTVNNLSGSAGTRITLGDNKLRINQTETTQLEGIISGAGGIEKTGAGGLSLTALNTYTGATTITQGTLEFTQENGLIHSAEVAVSAGATLEALGAQTIRNINSAAGSFLILGDAALQSGTLGGQITADTLKKTSAGTLALAEEAQLEGLERFELSQGELDIQTGNLISAEQIRIIDAAADDGAPTVLGLTIVSRDNMDLPLLSSPSITITGDTTLKVTGLSENIKQALVLQSEEEIDGMFNALSFNGNVDSELDAVKPITINDFSNGVRAIKSADNKAIYVINKGFVWFNQTSNSAHGTFFVQNTGNAFVVDADLTDRTDDVAVMGNDFGWNGRDLTKTGPGSLKLTGENSYTGDTKITEGSLIVSADRTLRGTGGAVEIDGGTSLDLAYDETDVFSKAVTGSGELVKSSGGTAVLTQDSLFTGTVRVKEGTLNLQSPYAVKEAREVAVEENGILTIGSPEEAAAASEISVLSGTGTVLLGNNTLRLHGGSFNGTLTGAGTLEQTGAGGILSLGKVQDNSFSGKLRVNGGAIQLDTPDAVPNSSVEILYGAVNSAYDQRFQNLYLGADSANLESASLVISDNKTLAIESQLRGNGTIEAKTVTLTGGAYYNPGNSPGAVTVKGDMVFEAGSVYQVDVDIEDDGAVEHDKLLVSGTVILNSPAVELRLNDITKVTGEKHLQIVNAAGGRVGEFQDLDYLFFDGRYTYNSWLEESEEPSDGEVWLHLKRSLYQLQDFAESVNQKNLVAALESSRLSNPGLGLYHDLLMVRTSQESLIRPLYNNLTGEIYASLLGLIQEKDWLYSKEIRNRFRYIDTAAGGKVPLWTRINGNYTTLSGDGNAADLTSKGMDLQLGAEFGLGNHWFLGGTVQGQYSLVEVPDRESTADIMGFGGGLYTGAFVPIPRGAVKFGFGAVYGLTAGFVERHIESDLVQAGDMVSSYPDLSYAGTLNETQGSSFTAHSAHGLLDVGLEYDITDRIMVEPFVGASWQSIITHDISESPTGEENAEIPEGGYVPIKAPGQHHWNISSLLGARSSIDLGSAAALSVSAGWRHLFGEATPKQQAEIKNIEPFTVFGVPLNVDSVDLGLGLDIIFGPMAKLTVGYNLDFGRSLAHNAAINFSFFF
jgi:autotransporter-associated beta strand protein